MEIPFYQVDAFTGEVFGGNPAGVCPLENWLEDDLLLAQDTDGRQIACISEYIPPTSPEPNSTPLSRRRSDSSGPLPFVKK